jgi:hypothetical protein
MPRISANSVRDGLGLDNFRSRSRSPTKFSSGGAALSAADEEAEDIYEVDDIRQIAKDIIDKKAFIWAFGQNKDGEIGIGS